MNWSELINIILGGGLIACVISILTLKATVREANAKAERADAEAEKAFADAETVRIDNAENATRILVDNIVKPLKEELNATREDLQSTKKEMASTKRELARFRKALDTASGCPYADGCPVLHKLRDDQKNSEAGNGDGNGCHEDGCNDNRLKPDGDVGGHPFEQGDPDNPRGQP
jgi:hypothetical protein